jgi:signal transduction histidine kinase
VGVSHEINTPLGTSITALSLLQDKVNGLLEMKNSNNLTKRFFSDFEKISLKCLEIVTTNLNRTSNLVQNFKQIAVDQSDENKKVINVRSLIEESTVTATSKYYQQEFELEVHCEDDIIMDCYSIVLSQVVIQLVDNSFEHYTKRNCLNINIQVNDLNDSIEIVYKDSGDGITKKTYKHMFEPFYTTKRGSGNTGLGMHIVYNQVTQKLGGKIDYISREQDDAEFNIIIPKFSPDK